MWKNGVDFFEDGLNSNCQYTVQQLVVRSDNMEANNESS